MTLLDVIDALGLQPVTRARDFARVAPAHGYAADLLSCVMAGAQRGGLWVTLQAHANVVAVAALLDLAAVIITEGNQPDPDTLARADEAGVTLLTTPLGTYEVVGRLWELGVR
jgi:hypothetical protein